MQKINLNEIHIKVTNTEGYDIYINDIDNLKYRVIRAAHSIRNFSTSFTTFHWSDKDVPVNIRIIKFDQKDVVLLKPDQPPCVRSLIIQATASTKKIREFRINGPFNGGCYKNRIESAITKLKEKQADIVSLHDDLDDALLYAEETSEETELARKDFLNTYRAKHGDDYNYAVLIARLFKNYITPADSQKINGILIDVFELLNSEAIFNDEFRAGIPKIAEEVRKIVEKNLVQDNFTSLRAQYPDHPAIAKAAKQESLFDKMFDLLLALENKQKPKKTKNVVFSVQVLDIRLSRVRSILNFCKPELDDKSKQYLESNPKLQDAYKAKADDEKDIESYVKAIETNEAINILVHRLFKKLEAKSANILLHQLLIGRIVLAKKKKDLFKAAYLTMDLKALIEKWNESNASPTKVPALQV